MERRALSISTSFDYSVPIDEQLPLIAGAGFSHVSLGENIQHSLYPSPDHRKRISSLLKQHGLQLDTLHGPRADRFDDGSFSIAIEAAADLGAPIVVAHGGPFDFPADELPHRREVLLRACEHVLPLLRDTGVKLALENVLPGPATDLVVSALPDLDPEHIGFCYDSAHHQIDGPHPFDLVDQLSDRIIAVHLSDRIREFVDHVPPGDGFIDWQSLCGHLAKTTFDGPLLLEVMVLHSIEKEPSHLLQRTFERGTMLSNLMDS